MTIEIRSQEQFEKVRDALKSGRWADRPEDQRAILDAAKAWKEQNPQTETESFASDVRARAAERTQNALESIRRFGAQGPLETGFQLGGETVGLGFDVMLDALTSGGRGAFGEERAAGLGQAGANVLAGARDKASSILNAFDIATLGLGSAVADRAAPVVEDVGEFIEGSPRTQANINAALNIGALVAPPTRGIPKSPGITSFTKKGSDALIDSAARLEAGKRSTRIRELVTPEQTKKQRTRQATRTKLSTEGKKREGIISDLREKREIQLEALQRKSAEVLESIPGVGARGTQSIQNNLNKVQAWVRKEADKLSARLVALGERGRLDVEEVAVKVSEKFRELLEEAPTLVGDALKSAERVENRFLKLLQASEGEGLTAAGLLQIRRDLDQWVLDFKPRVFNNDAATNAMTEAVRTIRGSINDVIDDAAHNVDVHRSLGRQSAALRAMDDMAVKAGSEPVGLIKAAAKRMQKIPALRNSVTAMLSVAAMVGPVAAAAQFAAPVGIGLGAGALVSGGAAAIRSSRVRRAVGQAIQIIDRAVQTGLDPRTAQALKVDRAVLVDWLEQTEEE